MLSQAKREGGPGKRSLAKDKCSTEVNPKTNNGTVFQMLSIAPNMHFIHIIMIKSKSNPAMVSKSLLEKEPTVKKY